MTSGPAGEWVARKGDRVVARAATAQSIVRLLGRLGRRGVGAVAKWEPSAAPRETRRVSSTLEIETSYANHPGIQRDAEIVFTTRRRRLRLFAAFGTPPGSHIGLWHTNTGTVHGWNLRVGRRYVGPCLTLLAHTGPPPPAFRDGTATS